ncbi:MAG: TonB family protein [Bryobacterales bacterium]|nr:TonB family protein [Bryobacterales bacterium]
MTFDLATRNFVALLLQLSVVGAIGALLPTVLRLRAPRPLLYYWQALLGLVLFLPSLQLLVPARHAGAGSLPVLRLTATAVSGSHAPGTGRVLAIVIGAVALIRLGWFATGFVALCRYKKRSVPMGAGAEVEVRISGDIPGPVSFGILQPVILVPESWRAMSPELQNAVLWHELMHIRRHDWAVHLVEELIRSVLWFQPAIWYIVAQIRMVREQVVDLEVVACTRSREAYIQALLTAADARDSIFALPAPCFARKHQLVERIRKITKECRMSKRRITLSFAGIAIVLLAGGSAAVSSFPLQAAQSGGSGKVYKVKDGITPPRLVYKTEPEYTTEAKDAHIEGTVRLSMEISPEGIAQNIEVVQGLNEGLEQKAVDAIQRWRFAPGLKDGEPVTVSVMVEVNFHLK